MILKERIIYALFLNVTRTRGDDPTLLDKQELLLKCYPHTRG